MHNQEALEKVWSHIPTSASESINEYAARNSSEILKSPSGRSHDSTRVCEANWWGEPKELEPELDWPVNDLELELWRSCCSTKASMLAPCRDLNAWSNSTNQ